MIKNKRTQAQVLSNAIALLENKVKTNKIIAKQYPTNSINTHRMYAENNGIKKAIEILEREYNKYRSI